MIKIALTRGFDAIVDPIDHDALSQKKWFANVNGSRVYAMRLWRRPKGEGKTHGHTYLHRAVAERMGIAAEGLVIDHVNGDTLDNRRCNLRAVTVAENIRNQRGTICTSQNTTPGIVKRTETRWEAWIRNGEKRKVYLGSHRTYEEAVAARLKAEKEFWGVQPRRAWEHEA